MFPNGDTLYEYVSMRQSADRTYAARQRLAATAREAAGIQPVSSVVSESLSRLGNRMRERLRIAVASPTRNRLIEGTGRAELPGAGIV
jgi:hypothetical protein